MCLATCDSLEGPAGERASVVLSIDGPGDMRESSARRELSARSLKSVVGGFTSGCEHREEFQIRAGDMVWNGW